MILNVGSNIMFIYGLIECLVWWLQLCDNIKILNRIVIWKYDFRNICLIKPLGYLLGN